MMTHRESFTSSLLGAGHDCNWGQRKRPTIKLSQMFISLWGRNHVRNYKWVKRPSHGQVISSFKEANGRFAASHSGVSRWVATPIKMPPLHDNHYNHLRLNRMICKTALASISSSYPIPSARQIFFTSRAIQSSSFSTSCFSSGCASRYRM